VGSHGHEQGSSDAYVGQAVRTLEGRAPVIGAAKYTNDFQFPGQLYAVIVRSTHASAKILKVDVSGALKVSGVVMALDGKQAAEHINPITHYIDPGVFGGKSATVRCLAIDEVWHYGQPVAVVVAEDKRVARYAASRVQVVYDVTESVTDVEEAVKPGAKTVVPGWGDNLIMQAPFRAGDPEAGFAKADHVVKTKVKIHRFSTQPIETRCYNAVWEHDTESVTLYGTSQNPHPLRHVLSTVLNMPENKIRIVAPVIGGAFGMKMHGHPEEALMCLLAKLTGKPVKWTETREECLLIGAREQVHNIEMAFDKEGKLLALRDHFLANTGAPSACPGWGMAFLTGLTMPGPYSVRDLDIMMSVAVTNKPSWNAARGYGKEATAIALELAMDQAARELGFDPVELRLKNFITKDQFPYPSPSGLIYDSGDYGGAVLKALDVIDYEGWKARQAEGPKNGKHIGIGIAYELTPEGGALPGTMVSGYDTTSVRVAPDGSVRVLTGVTTPGTGNPTGIAQIVADELGVPLEWIEVSQGDTTTCPYGFGNYSGRSTIVGGGSAALAAKEVREKVCKVAAALWGVGVDDITLKRGVFSLNADPSKTQTFQEVCFASYTRAYDVASCITPPLEATATFLPPNIRHTPDANGKINPYPSYSNAAYVAVCEVDTQTGKVNLLKFAAAHDCGRVINPVLVEGQACGAISFGVGGSMFEAIQFDASGRQITRSFMDYVMPRCEDIPEIKMAHHDTPNPDTYMGLKGAGEAGVGGSAAAVANAINNALIPLGVSINDLPLSAPNVWNAIQSAKKAGQDKRKAA
jgi:aerobic carbon-monoxide dehydrogenase large subunit